MNEDIFGAATAHHVLYASACFRGSRGPSEVQLRPLIYFVYLDRQRVPSCVPMFHQVPTEHSELRRNL